MGPSGCAWGCLSPLSTSHAAAVLLLRPSLPVSPPITHAPAACPSHHPPAAVRSKLLPALLEWDLQQAAGAVGVEFRAAEVQKVHGLKSKSEALSSEGERDWGARRLLAPPASLRGAA